MSAHLASSVQLLSMGWRGGWSPYSGLLSPVRQDFPGRIGYWNQGFPPSGPMDSWSFRLGNILVGNDAGAAGLEAQFMGPTIKFQNDGVIATTGANQAKHRRLTNVNVPSKHRNAGEGGHDLRDDAVGDDLAAPGAGRGNGLHLIGIDFFDRLIQQLGDEAD